MKIDEVVDPNGLSRYNVNDDVIGRRSRDDTRKTKLFLTDINRLKKVRALKKLKALQNQDVLEIMYGGSEEEESGGGFGGGF